MEKQKITASNFKKYLTAQPFFIWNSLKEQNELAEENFDIDFWSSQSKEEVNSGTGEVFAQTFFYIDQYLRELLKKKGDIVILSGDSDQKRDETATLLDSNKIIIGPVFEYNGAVAKPFAFDTKTKTIINIKYSKKTKRSDIVKGYFDYSVISNITEVRDYNIYLPTDKIYTKGEIDLTVTDNVHPTNTGGLPGERNAKGEQKDERFMGIFKTRVVASKKSGDILLPEFNSALLQIEEARKVTQYSETEIAMDARDFGANDEWEELMAKVRPEVAGINGVVVSKKMIVEGPVATDSSIVLEKLRSIDEPEIINDNIKEYNAIKDVSKVVWYDFEGYSLPISPLDGVKPYQQLVFQVSVITTVDNVETHRINHVVDPKVIDLDALYKIIEIVYDGGAEAYVVYNRGYEIPRMREICNLLFDGNHPGYDKAVEMLDEIETNTVDLMNVFKIASKNRLPNIMLHDQKAKASIKNVEKHITKNHIPVARPITPYADLNIHNGGMAMNEAILRALGITGDIKWAKVVEDLKKYCENDVKAMIMVYDFITYLKEK